MQEKIIEIIVYLVNEMRREKRLGEIDLSPLKDVGYTDNEITSAFSWLLDKLEVGESLSHELPTRLASGSPHSHRVLHEGERAVISPDAFGFLIQLQELGMLGDMELELIIDRVMMAGYAHVGVSEIKTIAASIMFDLDDPSRSGSRIMLSSGDTIH